MQGAVGPGEVVWGAGGCAEGLRGASGAALQPEGAVKGAVTGVLRPKGAETVPWPMHAGCGVLARQFVVNQLEEATRQRWRGSRVVEVV